MSAPVLAWSASEMSEKTWKPSHFTPEGSKREMRDGIRLIAGLSVDSNRDAAIAFAARVLGLPFVRVREIFYGRAHRIDLHEGDRIRAYVQQAHHLFEERARLNAEIRTFRAQAPASLAAIAPPALPDLEAPPTQIARKRA